MLRSMLRKLSHSLTSNSSRPARPMSCRTTLAIEGLEDRLALSTASQLGSTMLIEANLGYTVYSSTALGVQSDVIVGAGPGSGPEVKVVDGAKLAH